MFLSRMSRPSQTDWLFIYGTWRVWAKGVMGFAVVGAIWTLGLTVWTSVRVGFRIAPLLEIMAITGPLFGGMFFGARWLARSTERWRADLLGEINVSRIQDMLDEANTPEDRARLERLLGAARANLRQP
jgi:hypothetical protein